MPRPIDQNDLKVIAAELEKLRNLPKVYMPSEKEKETNNTAHEIYNRVLAQVLNENGWTKCT